MRSRVDEIAAFTELGAYLDMPTRTYSSGMMIRLGFAVSTCIPPEILLMDEWLSAGDASFLDKAQRRMETFVGSSSIPVLVLHSTDLLRKWCIGKYPASARTDHGAGRYQRRHRRLYRRGGVARGGSGTSISRQRAPRALPLLPRPGCSNGCSHHLRATEAMTSLQADGHATSTVAIVVCNYNHARYLPDSLGHICSQTRPADQILVIDDGSTDDSWDVIQRFARDHSNLGRTPTAKTWGSRHRSPGP